MRALKIRVEITLRQVLLRSSQTKVLFYMVPTYVLCRTYVRTTVKVRFFTKKVDFSFCFLVINLKINDV